VRELPTVQLLPELRDVSPLELAARWPTDQRLMMLHSGRVHPRWARWSILASPRATWRFHSRSQWVGSTASVPERAQQLRFSHDPLKDLDAVLAATRIAPSATSSLPFLGGWVGCFTYDLGRVIEPRAQHATRRADVHAWPLIELAWCPDALVFDHVHQHWHGVGEFQSVVDSLQSLEAIANREWFELGAVRSTTDARQYTSMVSRTIEYIAAGDIFQANIAQCLAAECRIFARARGGPVV
jgi:para-aminobenzoate synthetase component 1